jgi:predicted DNA-binding protein with PD1-like motif
VLCASAGLDASGENFARELLPNVQMFPSGQTTSVHSQIIQNTKERGRTFALIFDTDDEVIGTLTRFAVENALQFASFTAIGAFRDVTLAYFDWERRVYLPIPIDEQVEVLSLIGDIAEGDDGTKVHAHVTVAKRDGSAHGGHLERAHVRPTLEVVLTETPTHLRRRHDPASGLPLIAAGGPSTSPQ